MADYPAMPLWTDAYLADTRHLSTMEHGAYLLLMMEAWRRPTCSLPDDDRLLARLAGLMMDEWEEVKPAVMAFWSLDGRSKTWTQKRLSKERGFVKNKSRSQRDKATKRWNKTKTVDATAMPKGMPEECPADAPTPTPTPTPNNPHNPPNTGETDDMFADQPPKPKRKVSAAATILAKIVGDELAVAMLDHRKTMKKPMTEHAAKLMAKKLNEMRDPKLAVERSITNGWVGVFDPDESQSAQGRPGGKSGSAGILARVNSKHGGGQ